MLFKIFLTSWLLIIAQINCRTLEEPSDFKLTILHVNDIHAHIEEMTETCTRCRPEDSTAEKCFGGAGRLLTKIKELRNVDRNHTLVLNAGDFYQGTIWYSIFKYQPLLEFANMVGYDALGLGNHDFDDGVDGIVPFIKGANFPVLASNINATMAPDLEASCNKSIVKVIDNRKIGIIGYVTTDTSYISNPGDNVVFLDEIDSVKNEAKRLKAEGVDILIALGHSGYELDLKMAKEIEEIDVVVGGHSHTFLWTDPEDNPSVETISGPYPTYITQASGKVVPVVQAYCYSKYLGHFELYFDENGELKTPVDGVGVKNAKPILLDKNTKEDPDVLEKINEYRPNMTEFTRTVGVTVTKLDKKGLEESNLGNAITDSMVQNGEWKDATISFMNNGGIRSDLEIGNITGEDVLSVLPFNNTIDRLVMNGNGIRAVLENFAAGLCPDESCFPGTFLQTSGLRIVYRIRSDNVGHRVESLKAPCDKAKLSDLMKEPEVGCEPGVRKVFNEEAWCDVEDTKNYTVALPSFLARGGSRTCNFQWNYIEHQNGTVSDYDTFVEYLENNSPLNQTLEGRLTFFYEQNETTTSMDETTTSMDETTTSMDETTTSMDETDGSNIFSASPIFLFTMLFVFNLLTFNQGTLL